MNGIEKITEKILGDAQAEAASILADAKKEADGIVASYQAEAAEKKQKMAEMAEIQAAEQERRIISSAELDARKAILARKQALIAKAFDATKKKITTMDEPSYIDFLCTLAAQSVLDGKEEVVLSAEDSQKFGQKVVDGANKILQQAGKVGELTLSGENRPIVGGLVLKGRDLEINCALDTVISLLKDDLSSEVAAALLN
ncbi:MAG: hypothetical protein HFI72_00780 [Peptococcaceae bacterium]|jgi:V/A-type H+-transporting ATPase subunit E|nr:hypothetical protein [Peptococcaceae bacterium]